MKARMKHASIWKTCVGAISGMIDEAAFKVLPEGMKMKAIDPSHICIVDFELRKEAFDEFLVNEPVTLGINFLGMDKILSRARTDDEFALELDAEKNRLVLTFKGASMRSFSMPLIDVGELVLPEPKLRYTASAEIVAGIIQDGLKDAELIGDILALKLSKDGLFMRAEGDRGSSELELRVGNPSLPKLNVEQEARACFNVSYLAKTMKAASPMDIVTVNLGTNLPITLNYSLADAKGRLIFTLAPRIEAE